MAFKFFSTTQVSNTTRSGVYFGNQVWSGNIIITGDTEIIGNLTVLPDTVVKFAAGDDQGEGDEVEKLNKEIEETKTASQKQIEEILKKYH